MKNTDGRALSPKAQEEIRIRAVRRVQAGESPEAVVKDLGFSRQCIYNWLARYREGGWDGLRTGSRSGRPRKLEAGQIEWIYRTIVETNPLALGFPFALWTRKITAELIEREFGIALGLSTVGRLIRKLGMGCQKPLLRAYQQDPEAAERWENTVYPGILKRAGKHRATLYFMDENRVRPDGRAGTAQTAKGENPAAGAANARCDAMVLSAVNAGGSQTRFDAYKGSVTAESVREFLNGLMHDEKGLVFLIWDDCPVHRSKSVLECVESFGGRLEIHTLPPAC